MIDPALAALVLRGRARLRAGLRPPSTRVETLRRGALLAACSLLALAAGSLARSAAATLPTAAAIAAFAVIYGIVRASLARHSVSAREGWLGALPVERTVRELGAASLALCLGVACSVALLGAMAAAGGPDAMAPVTSMIAIGLVAALAAWLATLPLRTVRKRHPDERPGPRARRVPRLAYAPAWPRSRAAPHLALWQRIRTAAQWRSAGRAWQFGALALALPRNTAVVHGVVLIVVVAAVLWWLTMIAASLRVHAEARSLLAPLAHDPRRLARTALRYPAFASGCAAAILALAFSVAAWSV